VTHSLPASLPAGFWSKAYIITLEEADEVAKVVPKRSIKAIANISTCLLTILSPFNKHIIKLRTYGYQNQKTFISSDKRNQNTK
jgi:hypothetical protein